MVNCQVVYTLCMLSSNRLNIIVYTNNQMKKYCLIVNSGYDIMTKSSFESSRPRGNVRK